MELSDKSPNFIEEYDGFAVTFDIKELFEQTDTPHSGKKYKKSVAGNEFYKGFKNHVLL